MSKKSGIEIAIEVAGGQSKLGRMVNLSRSAIHQMKENKIVPPMQCQPIHKATGVPLEQLNPKVYAVQ